MHAPPRRIWGPSWPSLWVWFWQPGTSSPFSSGWRGCGCHPGAGPALPFSTSEDFSALWTKRNETLEQKFFYLPDPLGWDRSVPPSLEDIKLVFNLQVSKPTDLFTVVLLVFLLSDVFELLVFRPPPCSSCERSEPTWQLLWSSLYNPWGCWLLTLYSSSLDCC